MIIYFISYVIYIYILLCVGVFFHPIWDDDPNRLSFFSATSATVTSSILGSTGQEFLKVNKLKVLLRSHEKRQEGAVLEILGFGFTEGV